MSIARAFTTRRVKQSLELRDSSEAMVARSTSKASKGLKPLNSTSIRHKISAPVELVSTTNMLSYNAPDLFPKATVSPISSTKSDDDSDSARSVSSTPPTSPDSPHPQKRAASPEPNHLSCYFTPPGQASTAPGAIVAPVIPQRAPSHTKKSYDLLTRQRSVSRMSEQSSRTVSTKASFSFSRSSSTSTSTTTTSHASANFGHSKPTAPPPTVALPTPPTPPVASHRKDSPAMSHPFGHELAQVSELAEEFTSKEPSFVTHQEEQELIQQGLRKFSAQEYISDVQVLYSSIFASERPARPARPLWI